MCGHSFGPAAGSGPQAGGAFGAPPPQIYAASAASSDAARALWVLGSLGVLVLTLGVFLGLLVFSPGLAVIFALVAIPIFVALFRFLRQSSQATWAAPPPATPAPAAREIPDSPAQTAAVVISVIGIAIFATLLLFVAAIVVFFIICSSLVHFK